MGARSFNDHRPHHVYRLFAADGTLLYIGCTEDVGGRIYMHQANRWSNIASYGIAFCGGIASHDFTTYPDKATARRAEREAIREQRPLVNRHHNPTRWQWVDGEYVMHEETEREVARLRAIVMEGVAERQAEMAAFFDELTARFTS